MDTTISLRVQRWEVYVGNGSYTRYDHVELTSNNEGKWVFEISMNRVETRMILTQNLHLNVV